MHTFNPSACLSFYLDLDQKQAQLRQNVEWAEGNNQPGFRTIKKPTFDNIKSFWKCILNLREFI